MPERAAVIDVGTNSVKLLVAEKEKRGYQTLDEVVQVVRLGDGLQKSGVISETAAVRTAQAILTLTEKARAAGAENILAVGTAALRTAGNAAQFIGLVEEKTGVRIRVIDGDEEARLSFAAVNCIHEGTPVLMFDAGGGSTEFAFGANGCVMRRVSVPIGALTLFDSYLNAENELSFDALEKARAHVRRFLSRTDAMNIQTETAAKNFRLVGVGGTAAVLGAVSLALRHYDRRKIEGMALHLAEVRRQLSLYIGSTLETRKQIPGMPADRALIAPAGTLLVEQILSFFGKDEFLISTRGLRHGVMEELFFREQ
ncbi:hypothetical protein LJC40_01220 [Synergistaceae bacterium OttesenSCG-928-D05]|nr:hypothetical protein [Synergistaceae bacterium OttesenSCG-928-D05]